MTDEHYWQWVPTLDSEIDSVGPGCIVDTSLTGGVRDIAQRRIDALSDSHDGIIAVGLISFKSDGRQYCCIPVRNIDIDGGRVFAYLFSEDDTFEKIAKVSIYLESCGLLCVVVDERYADLDDGPINKLIESIIMLYHVHIHPDNGSTAESYRLDDRIDALERIYDDYMRYITQTIRSYRGNPRMTDLYFNIKSHILYGRSFVDKYGDMLADNGKRLLYLSANIGESIDETYKSEEYLMNRNSAYNMMTLNYRMVILTILSICVAFFAGSIFSESFENETKLLYTAIGATSFFVAGVVMIIVAGRLSRKADNQ